MGTRRQLPKLDDLRPLVRMQRPELDPVARRLERALTIGDLRSIARRRTPRSVFDYTDGAAEAEISLRRARAEFARIEFQPSVLRDVSDVDLSVTTLGRRAEVPFSFAPTGFTRMMNHEGEPAVARVAARRGIPYALSTMGTTSIEDVADASLGGRLWFQLYVWRDRSAAEDLIHRAQAAGYEALILTVDVPVAGARLRDVRNGMTIPPSLTPKTLADMALHPTWWINALTTDPLRFASLDTWQGTVADLLDTMFDPTMTISDLEWLRSHWDGPLVVKGIQTVEDARRVVDAGADAVIVSNHGGRSMDYGPSTLEVLPEIVAAVKGRIPVLFDSGLRRGSDIFKALALGANGVQLGRAARWGLAAFGEAGAKRVIEILQAELVHTAAAAGCAKLADINATKVRTHFV